ncbi:hypothetical protein PENTCL1PPCAC_22604, partial [Pristionchus entomophagus]
MRDLTQIGPNLFHTTSTSPPPTLPLIFTQSSTHRPPYYRIPDTIRLERESFSTRVEGEATLSAPPREFVNSNVILESVNGGQEDLPFIGDSTTFEIPTASPRLMGTQSEWTNSNSIPFSFTPSPIQRDPTQSAISSFREKYFGTTEPSADPPSLEQLQNGLGREELVLFNSPEGKQMEGLTMEWNPIAPRLLPRREEKFHS